MDIISLYYFTELAKDPHMTRVAKRLYISQQTLSNHIQRVEEYYGAQLFHRKPTLRLTSAGEYVLRFAQLVVREDENLKSILFDVAEHSRGVIRYGASHAIASMCVPNVAPKFLKEYPDVEIRVTSAITSKAIPLVMSGELDFACVLAGEKQPQFIADPLIKDRTYLCVHDDLLRRFYGEESEALKVKAFCEGLSLEDIADLPIGFPDNTMGGSIQAEFDRVHVIPKVQVSTTYSDMQLPMCLEGEIASFCTQMILASHREKIHDKMNVFEVNVDGKPMVQDRVLIHRRDRHLASYSVYFMNLIKEYCAELDAVQLKRKV